MSSNPYAPSAVVQEIAAIPTDAAPLATRGDRLAGALIDNFLLFLLVVPITLVGGFAALLVDEDMPEILLEAGGWLVGIAVFLVLNGYLLATRGQTIGKLVMKTQIVDQHTNTILPLVPLLLKRYAWLWLVIWIPGVGHLISIVDSVLIFRERRACLHDDTAGTKVIKLVRP